MSDPAPNEDLARSFVASHLVPFLGVLTSEFLALGPLSSVRECRRLKDIGELNPTVFPILLGNSIGWVIYSSATRNPYIFAGNAGGVLLALFYLLSSYSLVRCEITKFRLEVLSVFMLLLWCSVGFAAAMLENKDFSIQMIGVIANIVVFLLFASPLSTFAKVVSLHDSSSINRPFAYCQILNCVIWSAYGLYISDIYVYLPNLVGLALGIMQLGLIILYPKAPPVPVVFEEPLTANQEPITIYSKFEQPAG